MFGCLLSGDIYIIVNVNDSIYGFINQHSWGGPHLPVSLWQLNILNVLFKIHLLMVYLHLLMVYFSMFEYQMATLFWEELENWRITGL
jgi:hypothetical protein